MFLQIGEQKTKIATTFDAHATTPSQIYRGLRLEHRTDFKQKHPHDEAQHE